MEWVDNIEARRELAAWAGSLREWTWWTTLTYRLSRTSVRRVQSHLRSWLCRLNSRGVECHTLLWSVERQSRGTPHIHALLACTPQTSLPLCDEAGGAMVSAAWKRNGFARTRRYRPELSEGGVAYVVKYTLSYDMLDWGVWERGKEF